MLPFILAAGSTLLEMESKRRAGSAEFDAGSRDLEDAALSGHFREKGISEKRDRVLSSMRARAGASGVELTGSPMEVLLHAAGQAERDLFIAQHVSQRASESARRRMAGGERMQKDAYLEGLLNLGKDAVKAGTRLAGEYKPAAREVNGVAEEDWMKEYGND